MRFRATALSQLQQADRIDEAARVVPLRGWILAAGLTAAIAALLVWAIFGEVAHTTTATGIVSTDRGIGLEQAAVAGRVTAVLVEPGDSVAEGQAIAEVRTAEGASETLRASSPGTVLNVAAAPGRAIAPGAPLVSVDPADGSPARLEVAAFVPAAEGQGIAPGQDARLTVFSASPATHGFLEGKVSRVSTSPATTAEISDLTGNDEVAASIAERGPTIVVHVALTRDGETPSGLRWSIGDGPPFRIRTGTLVSADIVEDRPSPLELVFGR